MGDEHLAREGETYAGTSWLGGEERNEDVAGNVGRYWLTIVANHKTALPTYVHKCGTCLDGVLCKVDKYLAEHSLVDVQRLLIWQDNVPAELGIERSEGVEKS